MWRTDTLWFDIAVVMTMIAVGSILFGHFEEHKPKWRRLLKVLIVLAVVLTLSATVGRVWGFGVLVFAPVRGGVRPPSVAAETRYQRMDWGAKDEVLRTHWPQEIDRISAAV